ncbi:energy transducer TonB [Denitratisoma sp. DHT3]|uniref:energy transducer TonB n=1 Tax=Denitratisoma sp. DHT3 TaxID=1981880 RepID=UPI001645ABA2|nr:energy transducer TonB [Denitratisoma sp. DHT3]
MPSCQDQASPGIPPRRYRADAGDIPLAWRHGAFVAVLLAHGLGLVAVRYVDVSDLSRTAPPGVIQVSWIDTEHPQPPADPAPSVKPKPLPIKPRSAPAARLKPKPVLALADAAPSPIGQAWVAPPAPDDVPGTPEESADSPKGPVAAATTRAGAQPAPMEPSFDADYLSNPAPEYPAMSRMLREQGRVALRVHVTAEGRPDVVQIDQGSGFEHLDRAAAEAVWRWRFVPARYGGKDVAGWVIVPIRFSLRS